MLLSGCWPVPAKLIRRPADFVFPCCSFPDAVVTAARMAGNAGKRGKSILCSEATKKAFDQMASSHYSIEMHHVGATLLKGSTVETQLYFPEIVENSDELVGSLEFLGLSTKDPRHSRDIKGSTSLRVMEDTGTVRGLEVLTRDVRQGILKIIKQIIVSGCSGQRVVVLESPSGMGKEVITKQVQRFISGGSLRLKPSPRVIHLACTSISTQFSTCYHLVNALAHMVGHILEIPSFLIEV